MSRLWTDPTSLYLSPSCMALFQPARRTVREAVTRRLSEGFKPSSDSLSPLLAAVTAASTRLHLVLSNHYCRFQLVWPQTGIQSDAEFVVWSALRFERDAGLEAASFAQRLSNTSGKAPAFACAIDQTLLQAMEASLGAFHLVKVEPLFVAVFNACRKQCSPQAMLAVVEPGRIVLGRFVQGEWSLLASRFIELSDRAALWDVLRDYREVERGIPELWLFDPTGQVDPPTPEQAKVHWLPAEIVKPAAIALGLTA